MFYCEKCRKHRHYPESLFKSYGSCELCGKTAICHDVKSSLLPMPPVYEDVLRGIKEHIRYDELPEEWDLRDLERVAIEKHNKKRSK